MVQALLVAGLRRWASSGLMLLPIAAWQTVARMCWNRHMLTAGWRMQVGL